METPGVLAEVDSAAVPVPGCANCGAALNGPYCGQCGQPRETYRRSVWRLLHDLIADLASFDSRILRTARALLLRPGELPLAFREGRTQPYVPPVRLYLFVTLIFFLVLSLGHVALVQFGVTRSMERFTHDASGNVFMTGRRGTERMSQFHADAGGAMYAVREDGTVLPTPIAGVRADGTPHSVLTSDIFFFRRIGAVPNAAKADPLSKSLTDFDVQAGPDDAGFNRALVTMAHRLQTDPAALNAPLTEWLPRALFLLLPAFALVLALFHRRLRPAFLFVDHLVFSLNFHSFGFVALLLAVAAAQLLPGGAMAWSLFGALSLYLFLAMKRFYALGWMRTGVKFTGVSLIYTFFFLLPVSGGLIAASVYYG